MLSQKAKYALRALMFLAGCKTGESMQVRDIATAENLPHKFLEATLLELRKHGILESHRGRSGGYRLARPAHLISFGEVNPRHRRSACPASVRECHAVPLVRRLPRSV